MTQKQMTPPRSLPPCAAVHVARYIHDGRRLEAKGGAFIECRCSRTVKCATFDLAWAHWHKLHGLHGLTAIPTIPTHTPQLQLRLAGGRR